jgi:excisionase family DNA binding protein
MEKEYFADLMNVRAVARYLGINEKKIYFLAKAGQIPCTRVTGKWTFPKKLIDQWIEHSASGKAGGMRSVPAAFVPIGGWKRRSQSWNSSRSL